MSKHKDGSFCDGGGFGASVFDDRSACPLCCRCTAAAAVEDAAIQLRLISYSFDSVEAFEIAENLKGLYRRIERLTWKQKGGAA